MEEGSIPHHPSPIIHHSVSFAYPLVLWLLLAVPAAAALYAYAARKRREALALFFGASTSDLDGRTARLRRWRGALITAVLGLLIVAAAGPRYGTAVREARQESLDLIVALDVSASMLAEDVAPDRLERAKLALSRLADERRGDRIGLVVFAGDAFLQCPLTTDRSAFRLFLDAASPSLIATPGTDFARALFIAEQAFTTDEEERAPRPRAVLVVSDGEDHEGGLSDALGALRDDGITLLAAGIGTEAGGPIPIYRNGQRVGNKRENGETIITTRQDGVLREIAGETGLVVLGQERDGVAALSTQLDRLDRSVVGTERFEASAERYMWPLGLALLLLLVERLLALGLLGMKARTPVSR